MSLVREALRQIRKKPCTLKYPTEKTTIPAGFRGLPKWDMEKCILCILCQNSCPPGAIRLVGKGRDAEISYSLDKCIFCAECVEACPKGAITMSEEFELAGTDRTSMVSCYRKKPAEKPPEK
jgi:formate hydrogenlyase subunit 6/NADH:ubiquinone oxidoreductase subunit I